MIAIEVWQAMMCVDVGFNTCIYVYNKKSIATLSPPRPNKAAPRRPESASAKLKRLREFQAHLLGLRSGGERGELRGDANGFRTVCIINLCAKPVCRFNFYVKTICMINTSVNTVRIINLCVKTVCIYTSYVSKRFA